MLSNSKKSAISSAKHRKTQTSQVAKTAQPPQSRIQTTQDVFNGNGFDIMYHEEAIVEDAESNWSHPLDHCSPDEEETMEEPKHRKVFPYQLQQWTVETSNANIPLSERLEKFKWKYESIVN